MLCLLKVKRYSHYTLVLSKLGKSFLLTAVQYIGLVLLSLIREVIFLFFCNPAFDSYTLNLIITSVELASQPNCQHIISKISIQIFSFLYIFSITSNVGWWYKKLDRLIFAACILPKAATDGYGHD